MPKYDLDYIVTYSANQYKFLPLPYLLIEHSAFKPLSNGSKILYTLMLNRLSLSETNKDRFTDDKGRLYIIYTVEQVMKSMNCSNKTAVKYMGELVDFGLIERVRGGQGKAAKTYVKDFASMQCIDMQDICIKGDVQKCNNYTSRNVVSTLQEVYFLHSSNTDISNTDISLSSKDEKTEDRLGYGIRKNVYLSAREYKQLQDDFGSDLDTILNLTSERIFGSTNEIKNMYKYIRKVAQGEDIKTKTEKELVREKIAKLRKEVIERNAKLGYKPSDDDREYISDEEYKELCHIADTEWERQNNAEMETLEPDGNPEKNIQAIKAITEQLF